MVTRALWQVESEIAGDGAQVAEDASKLRVSTAANKLLVASFTGQRDERPWLEFLANVMSGSDGECFVALVPNYKNQKGYARWSSQLPLLDLYHCRRGSPDMTLILKAPEDG